MSDQRRQTLADPDVEDALIGACILSDHAIEQARHIISPGDFVTHRNQEAFRAICEQHDAGNRIDVVTLAGTIGGDKTLGWLHELQNNAPSISNAGHYARTIADWRLRRDLMHVSHQIAQTAKEAPDAGEAADIARSLLEPLDMPDEQGAPDPDIDTFIASVDTTHDWLVPDFLERRDRMLVTAQEGGGKSVLLAQIAVQVASGIHPWTHGKVTPRNVLLIDLENPDRLVTRRLDGLRKIAGDRLNPQRLRVHSRPDGIDLTSRTDRRWLIDRCRANNTELLVIGPAYRMSSGVAARGDIGGEDQARQVTKALDDVRNRCNVTLILETHAPHSKDGFGRDLRPFGSSVWLRWPEFGIGLRRKDPNDFRQWLIEHWRLPRDVRTWPEELHRNAGQWLWTPSGMPTGTFNNRRP